MGSRDYYKVSYNQDRLTIDSHEILDNDTEFNANQFKLYDDFTTDLRMNFTSRHFDDRNRDRRKDPNSTSTRHFDDVTNSRARIGDPNDSGVDMENGNPLDDSANDKDLLENEVMVDPWSSMDSTNSPLTDSVPSASEDCTPSTSSEPRLPGDGSSPSPSNARRLPDPKTKPKEEKPEKSRPRDLTLDLDKLEPLSRRPHFLDEDFSSSKSIECRIPKPHFLDHSPSPDELDERSDITNPNFLDDEVDCDDHTKKSGALPKRPIKPTNLPPDDRAHRSNYRSPLQYGLENAARSSERDKRASQLYRGTWPGERDVWSGHDSSSVKSFSSNGSNDGTRSSSNLENKMECVCSLISLLSLSPENNADLSGPLLDMSRSAESCIAMRQAGCIPLLVQLIHSKVARETRDRAAKALRNIIHTQTDDKAGRREARVWRLLEQVREYCYVLEDIVEAQKEGKKEMVEDDNTKHPSQSVAALMKLSFDEEHRHVVCQLGGLQALAALVSGDQAAHGSRTDDNTCLTMRKYAGMTLTNLTFGDGNNKSLLCSFKDFMLALVEQLESPNDDMRQVTAAVLRNLSWRADTNSKQVLREVSAVKGLTKAAMTCQKEATLKSVLSALWNLTAHCSMNKVALCSVDGALGFLVDMLSYDSPTKTLAIVENAGGIMRNVSSHIAVREDYRQILRERNCLSVLLQHLKSPSLTVVSNSCGTLWNLSARCPQDQQFLWDHGAVPMLRSLIHSKHKMIAMGSSAALKNLLNSKPGKTHIIGLDATARSMNLPALPTLGVRKQKALEQELDQNLAETCDNIEPATSPTTSNREEKNLFTATERQIAMNLERHRMTSSSPLMGTLTSQISLSHSAHLASYLSCSNTLLKGALTSRSASAGSSNNVNRSDSKDSVTSTHSDSVFERAMRTGKVPIPTPRNKDLMKTDTGSEGFKIPSKPTKENFLRYPTQPPIPPPRSSTEMRTNYTESGYDVDQDSCDQPIDYSRKYSETKVEAEPPVEKKETKKFNKKEGSFGDYQETDLDQPTDYSLRYAEHPSETGSDSSEPPGPSINEDTIKHFATEGTPYETPIIFSTATSMSDLRVIGKDGKPKSSQIKENPEIMTHSDEKDTCSIEDPPRHDNDRAITTPQNASAPESIEKRGVFDTKFSSGMISPEKPVNYCDEGTPGYFSRVSSLSSLGEPTEEDSLAKKNAMATINVDPDVQDSNTSSAKDKEGSKAVTFASEPGLVTSAPGTASPAPFIEDTPLMFSRSSSLGSLPDTEHHTPQDVLSEVSRLTSGCISPSEIPDSPLQSAPLSPRSTRPHPHNIMILSKNNTPPPESGVFAELPARFLVEHTPAHFSASTSLSSLTIDDDPKHTVPLPPKTPPEDETKDVAAPIQPTEENSDVERPTIPPLPASRPVPTETPEKEAEAEDSASGKSSDSSSEGSEGELLHHTIQKGIAQVVKNKGPTDEVANDENYSGWWWGAPPPPLPPRRAAPPAPPPRPAPAPPALEPTGRKHESRLPIKTQRNIREKPKPAATTNLARNDSLSSLSIESFGSTDREIFEETVKAGLCSVNPRASFSLDTTKGKAHSVERPQDTIKHSRHHKSLDRSDKITQHRPQLDKNPPIPSGSYKANKLKKEQELGLTRSPYSYHGEPGFSLSHHSRRGHSSRYLEDGPPSLPARIDEPRHHIERSNSLSSLSNDSFGSTDKEVFERCVRMGMSKSQQKKRDDKLRVRSDDRLEVRESRRRRRDKQGALERMVGEEYSKDRAILEEVIARGAGDKQPKNVQPPSTGRADVGGGIALSNHTGFDDSALDTDLDTTRDADTSQNLDITQESTQLNKSNELPTIDSGNTTLQSAADVTEMDKSNECLAPKSMNTTIDSEVKDELNRSNESYADVLDGSWSDESPRNTDAGTLTRKKNKLEWTDIKCTEKPSDEMKKSADTWNDNTCPDDVTFPTISGSVNLISSIKSEALDPSMALPDLLEKSEIVNMSSSRPDLTNKLDEETEVFVFQISEYSKIESDHDKLENIPEPSLISIADDNEHEFDSIMTLEIEKEAARLAAQLKISHFGMENSVTSVNSLDLDNIKPPSNLGSLLSLSASGHWDDNSAHTSKKSQKSRKKSLPVALMVKRALSNSLNQGSSEHIDSTPVSLLDNVKPPLEMEHIDMESSMISVSSIASEVVESREKTPVVFDLKQPIQDFPLCNNFVYHDLDTVNPPSLFDELAESTIEIEQTTAQDMFDDCLSTLNVVTDIPSGSEHCTPIPSDISSVESTPKRQKYLTAKEKRHVSKDRYQTYTLNDPVTGNDVVLEVETDEYLTWTKSESDKSDDYLTATSEIKSKRKVSAKQRRLEDRARYQTQTVDIQNIPETSAPKIPDPEIESLKQRLAAKKTMKQKRMEDAERFRTRTLNEDIPPSPTFVTKDANFENVETTTGYDSLSSNEANHQQILDERSADDTYKDVDSGHNEDDFELSAQINTYTKSFRNYLPITSPTAVDLCVVNNLKNIEMTASYRRALQAQSEKNQNPSSSDFASYEGDSNSEDKAHSESDTETPQNRPKPKIIKPGLSRDVSLDSNDSQETEGPKAIRGRKKAMYVSPYRRNVSNVKKPSSPVVKTPPKALPTLRGPSKISAKAPVRSQQSTSKTPSANTSPKKALPNRSPTKTAQQKPIAIPLVGVKPLPLERQGTFTKEESSVPAKELIVPDRSSTAPKTTQKPNTSPSRLPQFNRNRPSLAKSNSSPKTNKGLKREPTIKASASNHSLQSNDSGKTVTLNRGSRQGSSSSVNSQPSKNSKDIESKIANLWKKVEQSKKQPTKSDKRVWIEKEKIQTPKLIRSSTFEGQPKLTPVSTAPKQKTTIGMRTSQIPSLRPKSTPAKVGTSAPPKKPTNIRSTMLSRKPTSGQVTS